MNKKITLNPKATLLQPGKGSTYLVLGDLYTFLAVGEDTGGAYALYEMVMQPQSITPPHSHDQADESHYILEGEVEYQYDEQTTVATQGTYLHFPKGLRHSFKNIGSKPAKVLTIATPSGPEQFFAEVGRLVNPEQERNENPPPSPGDIEKAIEIASTKYGIKFSLS
ncbi:cupin domain-containing protein [Nostoc sp. FACHB-888]|uniref:cupin domain-containing protein n=1 Tax=Nostoc sp. FACHB-888 TaxID=2692842 RepID=UPI001682C289|nr:cupin domain-containing protein [Nostoc sp. FACHB-888]MBD2247600.1 cupin domain-containing protein [Nostoc sp. FACHB-888]MCC5654757.1 cupin domain-containing protein [Nostoc sp. XA013]